MYEHNLLGFISDSLDNDISLSHEISALRATMNFPVLFEIEDSEAEHYGLERRLSASSGSTTASSHSSSGGHAHQHDALLYLFNALIAGAAVMQISAMYPWMQQTVALFVLGFLVSIVIKGFKLSEKLAVWGTSYEMWMSIDPHLLLFTLLPALLAGDAMTIDTSVARKVAFQCLWLAGPGVLVGGFGCAGFLYVYLDWDFWLCLCAGAILCATDPVAVVALLKELGASPMLTVQIQGESLLNDGTAIVLYLISYDLLSGETYEWTDVAEFLIKKAMMAWAIGLFIGYFFFSWIRMVANKLEHSSSMIQITLTLCSAYWSFVFVEGVLHLSGVLATVASSLVLAHHMWPYVVSTESMHHVWHTFESLGNIIIFFLAGSITGKVVFEVDAIDYVHLIVIYLFLLALRACIIFGSRPILQLLSFDGKAVAWQDAAVMTWGGLRGAVGLALAIQVNLDRAPEVCNTLQKNITEKQADRLLFYVAGVAFLTMVVNATTAPIIVNRLGITATPQARKKLLHMFHSQLVAWSKNGNNPPEVTNALVSMLERAEEEIDHQKQSADGPKCERSMSEVQPLGGDTSAYQDNENLLKELEVQKENCRKKFQELYPTKDFHIAFEYIMSEEMDERSEDKPPSGQRIAGVDRDNPIGNVEDMKNLVNTTWVDVGMAKIINKCFLELVLKNYWDLIEEGDIRPGSTESEVLFTSVRVSMSPFTADLRDYKYIHDKMMCGAEFKDEGGEDEGTLDAIADEVMISAPKDSCLAKHLSSWQFNVFVAVVILLNSIQVICEELFRDTCTKKCPSDPVCVKKDIDDHAIWLVLDTMFTGFFTLEFALKFGWLKCAYFMDNWNRFDFFLVVVGIFGLSVSYAASGAEGGDIASQTRIIRIARVLRTLRFLRIFRLFHAKLSADRYISLDLARHMKKIVTLRCFVGAQLKAQSQLVKYFGGNGKLDEKDENEIARCVLQSQVSVYRALQQVAATKKQLPEHIRNELMALSQRKRITERLSDFVSDAHEAGALSATEAHAILHPLNHQVAECMKELNDRAEGYVKKTSPRHHGHGHGDGATKESSGALSNHASDDLTKKAPTTINVSPKAEDMTEDMSAPLKATAMPS
jgi:sodium/hydrogen exchanger 10/11